ncbi:MAG TPA: hypothetical protein VMZ92_05780 [Planctomycetota bacterium]|nr:hypothetical protein [Planctomycetota bacterium]
MIATLSRIALIVVLSVSAGAFADADTRVLLDFEDPAEGNWSMLRRPQSELDEPAAKVEVASEGATSGKRALKVTFDGGRLPAITTDRLPAADWMQYAVFRADVTVDRPCVVGFRVLQQRATRINGWAKQITRWQHAVALKPGKTTVAALLHPNALSPLRADLGKVVALDIFACNPAKGQVVLVDNIRLDTAVPPELEPKAEPKTDFGIYPEPPAPKLPKAGETFTDPTFGTTILRVTDEADGDSQNAYSYWPSFNRDSTLFHIQTRKGGPTLYHFDPKAFKVTGKEPLFVRDPAFPGGMNWEGSIWSATDPKALFGTSGTSIASYSVETKKYTVIHDFSKELPDQRPVQMSRSLDDNVFGFHIKKLGKDEVTGFMAWRRSPEKVLLHVERTDLDEVQVDKTGRYLVVKTDQQGKGLLNVLVYDLETGKHDELTDDGPDFSPGHSDNGHGFILGADNWRNSLTVRTCAEPHRHYEALDTAGGHLSMLCDDEKWVLVSNYFGRYPAKDAPWPTFAQEIMLLATDGSMRVRRLAHVQTRYKGYWDCPRADISRDGRFVVFTSNWGDTGLRGVFILRVPDELVPKK